MKKLSTPDIFWLEMSDYGVWQCKVHKEDLAGWKYPTKVIKYSEYENLISINTTLRNIAIEDNKTIQALEVKLHNKHAETEVKLP